MADLFSTIADRVKARQGLSAPEFQPEAGAAYPPDPYPIPFLKGGSDFGNPVDATRRERDIARRGMADFSIENLGRLAGNVMSAVSPSGLIQTGAASILEKGLGVAPGTYGGFSEFEGYTNELDDDLAKMVGVGTGKISAKQAQQRQRERNAVKARQAREEQQAASARGMRGIGRSSGGLSGGGGGRFGFGGSAEGRTGKAGDLSRDPTPGKAGR